MKLITIAICTHNRSKYLDLCLNSIVNQSNKNEFEVLIVDNNSTEDLEFIFNKYCSIIPHLRIVKEKKEGLSFARNRAIKDSNTPWIAYIDDDAILFPNYIEIALNTIKKFKFIAFGGSIIPKYLYEKPKWIPIEFGGNLTQSTKIEIINNPNIIFGGNMIIKKKILVKIGGFKENLGMKKNKIGYGEETEIIKKIIDLNFLVGFVPELTVYHHVLPYKTRLIWHLKSYYQKGIAWEIINESNMTIINLIFHLVWNLLKKLVSIPIKIFFLLKNEYYWQNLILDFSDSILFYLGRIRAKLKL